MTYQVLPCSRSNVFNLCFNGKVMRSHSSGCHIFHCNYVTCHRDIVSTYSNWFKIMHHPSRVRKAYEPPFLLGITSLGSSTLELFPPIKIPTLIFSVCIISSTILSKYFHSLILLGVRTSSPPTGKSVLDYVTGRSIQTDSPINFYTFNPLIASDSQASSTACV